MKIILLMLFLSLTYNVSVSHDDEEVNSKIVDVLARIIHDIYNSGKSVDFNSYELRNEKNGETGKKITIDLYYESLCPDCIKFDTEEFAPVVEKLSKHLNIHTYPYGNAKTVEVNGTEEVQCQHGLPECYGNKLHACALDSLPDQKEALLFNACLMKPSNGRGSDDMTADECGKKMNIDPQPIKTCAKSQKGDQLLIQYGEKSRKVNYNYVPYALIDGVEITSYDGLLDQVCRQFKKPPKGCTKI